MGCDFCEIINCEKDRKVVDETDYSLVILSNPALVKGGCLVIPKRHVEKFSDLSKEEREDIMDVVEKMQEKILKNFEGCDMRQNYRPFLEDGKLNLSHLHVHLQPREFEDELYRKCQKYEDLVFKDLSESELNENLKIFS